MSGIGSRYGTLDLEWRFGDSQDFMKQLGLAK